MNQDSPLATGPIALVTGAGTGIGRATARALAGIGCRVVLAGRRPAPLENLAAEIGAGAVAFPLDVTDDTAVDGLHESLPEGYDDVAILVNAAGHDVGGREAFDVGTADQWAAIVETNVIGLMRVTRAIVPGMILRGGGHVVNIGSIAGLRPYATGTAYVASKFAVHGFSEALSKDYQGTGLRVTEILPGMVRTDFAEARWDDAEKAEAFYGKFGTILMPDDIARAVVFAVTQPEHVVIQQMVVVPSDQR